MRALLWIVDDTWEATVARAAALLPADAEVTLLHVAPADAEALATGVRHGLLGRPAHHHEPDPPLRAISDEAADALLHDAAARLGRPAARARRRGHVEREVIAAAEQADLLVLARDGDRAHLGPHSLARAARFVVDHAPCEVLLVWPDVAPTTATMPPPRSGPRRGLRPRESRRRDSNP